jgi:hypothetical protein
MHVFLATLAAALLLAGPAIAALSSEVSAGQAVAARLQSGQATCSALTSTEFEHLGEYVMERTLGSRAVHQAMNARMDRMMGQQNADRMHERLGREYAGCASSSGVAGSGPGMMSGGGMMGSGGGMMGSGGGIAVWGAMMSSPNWSWMRDGSWRHMDQGQWQRLGHRMLGGMMFAPTSGGWSPWVIIAIALAAAAAIGTGYVVGTHRRPPGGTAAMGPPAHRT